MTVNKPSMRHVENTIVVVMLCVAGCRPSAPAVYVPTPAERQWEAVHSKERQGDVETAKAEYARLCRASVPYVRACFDQVRLMFESGSIRDARDAGISVVRQYPDEALAPKTVKQLSRSYAKRGELDVGMEMLSAMSDELEGHDVWDTLVFECAVLARLSKRSREEQQALERIVAKSDRFGSQLWDDVVWRLSRIERERGAVRKEEQWLVRLIEAHQSSWLIGSYTSPHYDDALMRLGTLYLDGDNPKKALETFRALAQNRTSRKQNLGRLGMAKTLLRMGKRGAGCQMLERFMDGEKREKRLNEARELKQSAQCQ